MFEKPMKGEELMHILRKLKQKGLAECAFIDGQVQWRLTKAGLARGGDNPGSCRVSSCPPPLLCLHRHYIVIRGG